jgi:nucleoside-diphosphate-sugar epimerase
MNTKNLMPHNILITGSTGFIGKSLAEYYANKNINVFGFSIEEQNEEYIKTFIIDYHPEEIADLIVNIKPDLIIHAAGSSSVTQSITNPHENFKSSVAIFQSLMEGVRLSKLKPLVVFPSSAAVYGNPYKLPINEKDELNPISPYGYDKIMCENIARKYSETFKIQTLVIRLFSVFGKMQQRLLIWEIFDQIKNNSKVIIRGTGNESRDYIYIDDLAQGIIDIYPNFTDRYDIINVASGRDVKVKEIVEIVKSIFHKDAEVQYKGEKIPGDPENWRADIVKFKNLTDHKIYLSFEERLEQLLKIWCSENPNCL